jgi:hypothetical protein
MIGVEEISSKILDMKFKTIKISSLSKFILWVRWKDMRNSKSLSLSLFSPRDNDENPE